MTPKHYPMPEALGRGEGAWEIEPCAAIPGQPATCMVEQNMAVPLGSRPIDRIIRAHEMGHAKWSPDAINPAASGASASSLVAAEECRINTLLSRNGFPMDDLRSKEIDQGILREKVELEDWPGLVLSTAAAMGSGRIHDVEEVLAGTDLLELLRSEVIDPGIWAMDYPEDFGATERFARILDGLIGAPPNGAPGKEGNDELPIEMMGRARREGEKGEWGKMTIVTPPLVNSLIGKIGRKRKASDEGCIPRHMDRYMSDGMIFDRTRKERGGTVLIDCSGSMNLSRQEVESIVLAAPGSTVATYAADYEGGELRIVAKNGRVCDPRSMVPGLGGNVIDGPCLDWLAKQAQPRIWVCDGVVTGVGDQCFSNLTVEANNKAIGGKIKRVDTPGEAERILKPS